MELSRQNIAIAAAVAGAGIYILSALMKPSPDATFHAQKRTFKKPAIPNQRRSVVYFFSLGDFNERPHGSPLCCKVETFLKMFNIPYELVKSDASGPAGKWPYIVYNDDVITDSSLIISYLEKQYNIQYNCSEEQLATGHAVQRMLEEHVYWEVVGERWIDGNNWPTVRNLYFKGFPFLFQYILADIIIRPSMIQQAHAVGITRLTEPERLKRIYDDIDATSKILGDKKYFLGDFPSRIDAAVFSMLDSMCTNSVKNKTKDYVLKYNNLKFFINRMYTLYWPDKAQQCAV